MDWKMARRIADDEMQPLPPSVVASPHCLCHARTFHAVSGAEKAWGQLVMEHLQNLPPASRGFRNGTRSGVR